MNCDAGFRLGKMLRRKVSGSRIGRVGDDTHGARYPYILIIKDTN